MVTTFSMEPIAMAPAYGLALFVAYLSSSGSIDTNDDTEEMAARKCFHLVLGAYVRPLMYLFLGWANYKMFM